MNRVAVVLLVLVGCSSSDKSADADSKPKAEGKRDDGSDPGPDPDPDSDLDPDPDPDPDPRPGIPVEPWEPPDESGRKVGNTIISCGSGRDSYGAAYGIWGSGGEVWAAVDGSRHGHAALLRTMNAPRSWAPVPSGTACPLRGVFGFGRDDVYVTGWSGMMVHTSDRGASFERRPLPTTIPVGRPWGHAPGDLWVAGEKTIWHTDDGGKSWAAAGDIPEGIEALGLWGVGAGDVYWVGTKGVARHTSNGGKTWDTVELRTNKTLYDVWGNDAEHVFVVGEAGLLFGRQAGAWKKLRGESADAPHGSTDLYAVYGHGPKEVFAGGRDGAYLRSTDGGASWHSVELPMTPTVNAIWADEYDVFIAGHRRGDEEDFGGHVRTPVGPQGGPILHSKDRGKTWAVVWRE